MSCNHKFVKVVSGHNNRNIPLQGESFIYDGDTFRCYNCNQIVERRVIDKVPYYKTKEEWANATEIRKA